MEAVETMMAWSVSAAAAAWQRPKVTRVAKKDEKV
jgi:hypothetical protein